MRTCIAQRYSESWAETIKYESISNISLSTAGANYLYILYFFHQMQLAELQALVSEKCHLNKIL